VTLWFPEKHRAKAVTGFYFAVPLSSALMGGMAGGLLGLQGVAGLAGWQWLFLVQGTPAVILAVVILFALPDAPAVVTWLTAEEKAWLERRLAADAAGRIGESHNILRALCHPTVLALTAVNFLMLGSNYAFNLSAPTIVQEATGLSPGAIGFVAVVGSLLGVASMLAVGWNSDRTGQRHLHLAGPLAAVALALGVISVTDAPAAVIGAYVVFLAAASTAASQFFLTPGAILHPRSAAVGVAAINAVGQLGSFVLPALWGVARDQTGSYHLGLGGLAANFALTVAVVLVLRQRGGRPVLAGASTL
jgi:MFS transporter, ACS family, tartrate transporter